MPICPRYTSTCQGSHTPSMRRCDIGLQVFPKKGSVVLWYNYHPNGRGDQNALHGGCPPAKGQEKWSGNKWIHIKSLRGPMPQWMPDHPGLKRYGWQEDALKKLGREKDRTCKLFVSSEYPKSLKLFWITPGTGAQIAMAEVEPKGSTGLSSFVGHNFRVGTDGDETMSAPFVCAKAISEYHVTETLEVLPGRSKHKAEF